MPSSTASSSDAAIVEGAGQATQIGHSGCLQRSHNRQHIGCKGIGLFRHRPVPCRSGFHRIAPIVQLRTVSLLAASAVLARSEINRRSFSANAA
jgi:hypothetical protein